MRDAAINRPMPLEELEASQPLYCKMLRILIREGKNPEPIQRSICWDRLRSLHRISPSRHGDPNQLDVNLKHEICT